ncbi:MAG: S-layer homology domain-containing protein, partial [Anaerovorax sp.]
MKIHRRKMTAVLLAASLVAASLAVPFGPNFNESGYSYGTGGFTDIQGHWAESIIKEAASLGIVTGYEDGTFKPDAYINRQEFYKLLTGIMTVKPDTTNTELGFPDVVAGEWYIPTLKIAVAAGLASGYEDGSFGINRLMSRQESAKVAASVIQSKDIPVGAVGVVVATDKDLIGDWAYPWVDIMFKKKYMKGDEFGKFQPTNALKRAEATTILLNMKKNEKIIAANADKIAADQAIANQPNGCKNVHGTTGAGIFMIGQGSQADPYQITTEENLNHMRSHTSEAAFYVLKNDIKITKDFATVVPSAASDDDNWSLGNFQPIGTKDNPFKGNLDGGNYTISGLKIVGESKAASDKSPANYAGLFGALAKNSSVTNLKIDQSKVVGNQYTGMIVGYNEGRVTHCQALSSSVVEGYNNTGGLVGYSTMPLDSLRNFGSVTGKAANTGGVIGSVATSGNGLNQCQNDGIVTGA